ncbi:MAG: YdcF family protein, partial [Xanthobacteraceae bacterium]
LLALFGWTPLGNILMLPLEQRFPAWQGGGREPDGIVVLGGVFDTLVSEARGEVALTDAAERMTVVAELARAYPNARIVFSGGSGRLLLHGALESDLAVRMFGSLGIPASRIQVDERARDTLENAVFSKAIAAPKPGQRWLLVTSASHMPRSIGAFRRAGFAVEAYPVDWRTRGPADVTRPFDALADGLKRSDTAMREWIGLVTYWISGRTSELFPGPVHAGCDTGKDTCRP